MVEPTSRRVSYTQLETLWEFLCKNRDIATGFNKTAQAREYSRKMWMEVTDHLNSLGDGATKDWKGWCKYWNDYKSKIKKKAVAARSSRRQTGGGPSGVKSMTDIEKKMLGILGPGFGEGLPGMRVEPFQEEDAEILPSANTSEESLSILAMIPPALQPSTEEPGPSWRVSVPLPQVAQAETPTPIIAPLWPSLSTATPSPPPAATPPPPPPPSAAQQTTPRRRRRLRQQPLSQDATRRALIRISEEKAELARHRNVLLGDLVKELREIKEILRSRQVIR